MSLRKIYYLLPPAVRLMARKLYYFPVDLLDTISGRRGPNEPSKGDIYIGSGDFMEQGRHQVTLLRRYLDLQKDDAVLDVGCGIGRTALPLTNYLNEEGSYEGFDVVEKGVKWCLENISVRFPNFRFTYVDLANDLYNSSTRNAAEFIFPYEDKKFDQVFLFSVFTHMGVEEIRHYLKEIYRVLKPGGKCLFTLFYFNRESEPFVATNAGFNFPHAYEGYRLMDDQVKSANIALSQELLTDMMEKAGLKMIKLVEGHWKGERFKTDGSTYQDLVVVQSEAVATS